MDIRTAAEADREALRDLDRRAWTLATNPILPDGTMWMSPSTHVADVIVATLAERVIGYVHIANALPAHLYSAAHSGRLRGIAVAPEHRRMGIGARLLEAAEALTRDRGYRKLVLQVLGSNLTAQRTYTRAGYVCEGRLTGLFYLNGAYVDDLWFAKWL
jgi:ribosomal protein S18 acetylase RimI-like enzyme